LAGQEKRKMTRKQIPKKMQNDVLDEYQHRCSICGADRPQLHHIDNNPSNNDKLNLLPLCPNCHLTDQHNPTAAFPPRILDLFRRYKDPSILSPQFLPLYDRFSSLRVFTERADPLGAQQSAYDLVLFVSALIMGGYYSYKLKDLIAPLKHAGTWGREKRQVRGPEYLDQLRKNDEKVEKLIVELLRYQDWSFRGRQTS
jgi:hypothetical protein